MTTATYALKTKRIELEHGKMSKTVKKGHNIEDPACYPVPLHCSGDIDWKISLQSYSQTDGFTIIFNDVNFKDLPYQSEIVADGPQNIDTGVIKMNGVEVHHGFKVYADLNKILPKIGAVVTDLYIEGLQTSSADVVNQTIDDCSRLIHEQAGLQSLHISRFADQNQLTYWPFSQIAAKAQHLHTLKI